MKNYIFIFSLLFASFFISCQSNTTTSQADSDVVSLRMDNTTFAEKLKGTTNAKLVDVRTSEEFQQGAIEGAINIDFQANDFESKISQLDKNQPTFIYCQAGGRSGKALKKMRELGFKEVYELQNGYRSWKK